MDADGIRACFAALSQGDVDPLVERLAEDCVLEFPGRVFGGTIAGARGIRVFLRRNQRLFEGGLAFAVHWAGVAGDRAVAQWTNRGRTRSGLDYANRGVTVFTLREGKIARIEDYLDTQRIAETWPGAPASYLRPGLFEGKVALVTGGGTGLGLEVSTRIGRLGGTVVCASRDVGHHEDLLARGGREGFAVHSRALDVRDAKHVRDLVAETVRDLGGLHVVVNNAAGNFVRPAMLLAPRGFSAVVDIALTGVFHVSREAGRAMRVTGGTIVNVSAPYAATGKPGVVHSACAKAGVEAMTRTLAAEWAPLGIRVNAVSPGPFESEGAAARLWPSEAIEQAVREQIPLGRFGRAGEVADLVCLLASDDLPWVTGAVWVIDGGWSLPGALVDGALLEGIPRRRTE